MASEEADETVKKIMSGKGTLAELVSDMINIAGWLSTGMYQENQRLYFAQIDRHGSKVKAKLKEIEKICQEKGYKDILSLLQAES